MTGINVFMLYSRVMFTELGYADPKSLTVVLGVILKMNNMFGLIEGIGLTKLNYIWC